MNAKSIIENVTPLINQTNFEDLKQITTNEKLNDNEKLKQLMDIWFKADVCTSGKCSKCDNFRLCFTMQGIY